LLQYVSVISPDMSLKPRASAIWFHQSPAPSHVLRCKREINLVRHLSLFVSAMRCVSCF
jgi:hypothetical protein